MIIITACKHHLPLPRESVNLDKVSGIVPIMCCVGDKPAVRQLMQPLLQTHPAQIEPHVTGIYIEEEKQQQHVL